MQKAGFVSLLDPEDRRNFSGTLFYMLQALRSRKDLETEVLGAKYFEEQNKRKLSDKIINKLATKIQLIQKFRDQRNERKLVKHILKDLESGTYDLIVAPVASRIVAKLPKNTPPIAFITDATPKFVEDFYGWNVTEAGYRNEEKTLSKAHWIIYSSDFMKTLARDSYAHQIGTKQVVTIPFGLNLDSAPQTYKKKQIDSEKIRLLFVARFWERKGGSIALQCLSELVSSGLPAHLTIIGCTPDIPETLSAHVSVIPFLNKNEADQQKRYFDILSDSHFFILPTRADCTPMVIAEANALSTPVLVTDVGGIKTLVDDGENGFLFDLNDDGKRYAEKIRATITSPSDYEQLCRSSFSKYESTLNWNAWADSLLQLVRA